MMRRLTSSYTTAAAAELSPVLMTLLSMRWKLACAKPPAFGISRSLCTGTDKPPCPPSGTRTAMPASTVRTIDKGAGFDEAGQLVNLIAEGAPMAADIFDPAT